MAEDTTMPSQNLNKSASPGGDGVQSSQAERSAAGLDAGVNQPAQQRINAAERRERGVDVAKDAKVGSRPSLVQSPGEVIPEDATFAASAAAIEQSHKDRVAAEQHLKDGDLPQATLDEMNAGKAALDRNKPRNQALDSASRGPVVARPTNPVDDMNARQRADVEARQQADASKRA